jgi:hypothetical protein
MPTTSETKSATETSELKIQRILPELQNAFGEMDRLFTQAETASVANGGRLTSEQRAQFESQMIPIGMRIHGTNRICDELDEASKRRFRALVEPISINHMSRGMALGLNPSRR